MASVIAFLKPTKIKLLFLVEYIIFILFSLTNSKSNPSQILLVSCYPLIFLYVFSCILFELSKNISTIAQSWRIMLFAAGLILLDQTIKIGVTKLIPYQTLIPISNNRLYLTHTHNINGSWIASAFNVQSKNWIKLLQWGLLVPILILTIFFRCYYINTYRSSVWVDIAFLGIFSAYVSWAIDMSFRGYVVDFILLPELISVDLKDIYLTIGVAAFFAEMLDNSQLTS